MSLNVTEALKTGIARTFRKNGIALSVLFILPLLSYMIPLFLLIVKTDETGLYSALYGLPEVGVSPVVLGLLTFTGFLLTQLWFILTSRTMEHQVTEFIPIDFLTRNIGWTVINLLLGGVVFGLLATIGLILLVIPFFFISGVFIYWIFYVTVEDNNFITAFINSWRLTQNNRMKVIGLFFSVVIIQVTVSSMINIFVPLLMFIMPYGSIIAALLFSLLTGFLSVFMIATFADAYRQMK